MDTNDKTSNDVETAVGDNSCTRCNVCDAPGSIDSASEIGRVPSNVRKFLSEEFTVWRCDHCGSLHSMEAVDLEHYYAHYFIEQQQLDYFTSAGFRVRRKWLESVGVTPTSRILEYGCGNGLFIRYLRDKGYANVVGFDRFIPEFADESWRDEQFDVVMSFDLIEHVDEPRELLLEQLSVLKPNGILSVGTPNAAGIAIKPDEVELHQPYHRHILSESALLALGESLGLKKVQVRNRLWMDTPCPFVNWTFVTQYVKRLGNVLDVVVEPPRFGVVLRSPKLLFFGIAGYLFPSRAHMTVVLRKPDNLRWA